MSVEKSQQSESSTLLAGATATKTQQPEPGHLPLYKVILHNDDVNSIDHVVETIVVLTPLQMQEAEQRTVEANNNGCSLLLVIHRERAELYVEQFQSRQLTVTIEPAD